MSLGINIAIGIGAAVVTRMATNAALQATLPPVDPALPMAVPVFGAAALPAAGGGLALGYKYPKVAAALFGMALGGAISTAEYMAYAREAQSTVPGGLPVAQAYTWLVVHKDGSLDTLGPETVTLSALSAKDAQVVAKYGPDPDVTGIFRKDAAGHQVQLASKQLVPAGQSGAGYRLLRR